MGEQMTRVIKNQDKHKNIIEFRPDDKKYRYIVNGEVKKGVTGLIGQRFGKAGLIYWAKNLPLDAIRWQLKDENKPIDFIESFISQLKDKITKLETEAATIGTLMHTLAEDYITGKKVITPESEPLKTMFNKFKQWWDKKGFKVIATETTCYSKELDVCGTFDAIVKHNKYKNKNILLDFKTSKDFYVDQPIQISTYKKLIEDSTNLKIDYLGIINIPKDPKKDISLRMFEMKPRYLKAFKVCQFLDELEADFKKRDLEYKKQLRKKEKNNAI